MDGLLVAVVDDEPDVRRALRRLFVSVGIRVEEYGTGTSFLASLDARAPDCVVLDLHMPEVSGYDVQAALAQRQLPPPVVVITGHDTPTARARAISAGAAAYLCKPVDDEALLGAVMRAATARDVH
ncbi:MAG TPA: response regulator [Xanthomonadales bacterium]|nr:response regulator [Xanthomonadales bacterium]